MTFTEDVTLVLFRLPLSLLYTVMNPGFINRDDSTIKLLRIALKEN